MSINGWVCQLSDLLLALMGSPLLLTVLGNSVISENKKRFLRMKKKKEKRNISLLYAKKNCDPHTVTYLSF